LRSPRDTTLDSAGGIASDASTSCCVGAPQCEAPECVDIVRAYLNGEMFSIYDRWDRRSDSPWCDEGAEISKGLEIPSYPQIRRSVDPYQNQTANCRLRRSALKIQRPRCDWSA